MNYNFDTILTEHSYLAANRLNFWVSVRSLKVLRALMWAAAIYLFAIISLDFLLGEKTNFPKAFAFSIAGALAVLTICYALGYLALGMRTRKLFEQQKLLHAVLQYEITEEYIRSISKYSTTTLPYELVHKWAESAETFLIYHSERSFQILPKADVAAEAIEGIKQNLISAGISGRTL